MTLSLTSRAISPRERHSINVRVADNTPAIGTLTAEFSRVPSDSCPSSMCIAIVSKRTTVQDIGQPRSKVLTPVVDHVNIGSIEPVRTGALHGDTLHGHSISVGAQAPVGIFASQVHASLYSGSARGCKRFANIQQLVETFTGPGAAASRTKLDVTRGLTALRSGPVQAHCESIEDTARVCQHDVAGALRKYGPDLTSQIESLIDLVGEFPAGLDGLFALAFAEGR